jgi:two-component system, OmpR family, response regulator CpxR
MSATILVLEDDLVLQSLLCEVLEDEGFTVVAADSLPRLLAALPPRADLLITDLLLNFEPVGLHAITEIRRAVRPTLPVLLCSAAERQIARYEDEITRLGASVLPKPFTIDELVGSVDRAMRPVVAPPPATLQALMVSAAG